VTTAAAAPVCPVCGGGDPELYLEEGPERLEASAIGSSRRTVTPGRVLRCRECRLGFRQTRAGAAELAGLYRRMDTSMYEAELAGRRRTAARHLRIVERYAQRGRLLDVGCASGLFLLRAVAAGWQVAGVEPSESLWRQAREALAGSGEVHCATLEEAGLPAGSFDAVTLWDVLEHVPDPVGFLRACTALLKPGGHLFLNVPDLESPEARLMGRRWPLLLPEHLNYFTRGSLRLCADKAGLEWRAFGRRAVWFSAEYVLYRLAQHRIAGAALLHGMARASGLGRLSVPVWLGESYGVWRC
jgi:SAM-dependent methyltransferase